MRKHIICLICTLLLLNDSILKFTYMHLHYIYATNRIASETSITVGHVNDYSRSQFSGTLVLLHCCCKSQNQYT
ncbi:hypothetical protein GGI43DRAFT_410749 [Trichoderma evansii]